MDGIPRPSTRGGHSLVWSFRRLRQTSSRRSFLIEGAPEGASRFISQDISQTLVSEKRSDISARTSFPGCSASRYVGTSILFGTDMGRGAVQ